MPGKLLLVEQEEYEDPTLAQLVLIAERLRWIQFGIVIVGLSDLVTTLVVLLK